MLTSTLFSRRRMLQAASCGFGYLAFAGLTGQEAAAAPGGSNPLASKAPHHAAKAKRIIFLCMQGGPSHLDTFDYKPLLKAGTSPKGLLASPFAFTPSGE